MKNRQKVNKAKDHLAKLKAEHRKTFLFNIRKVCDLLGGPGLFAKFPPEEVERIYKYRYYNLNMVPAEGCHIERKDIKYWTSILQDLLNTNYVEMENGRGSLSLLLMVVEGQTLLLYAAGYHGNEFSGVLEIKKALTHYVDSDGFYGRFYQQLNQVMFQMGLCQTNLNYGLVWNEYKVNVKKKNWALENHVVVHTQAPVRVQFTIEGNTRSAIRVGWAFPVTGIEWTSLMPSSIGIEHEPRDLPMEVYIQSHALIRLDERLGIQPSLMHLNLHLSIKELQYHWDEKGRLLIDFCIFQKKVGYLVCTINEGKLLILTFLFMTNSGTPEGKRLFEATGLAALDKKYLAIDRLSSFIAYNIEESEYLKDVFIKAGCNSLLDLQDMHDFIIGKNKSKQGADVDLIVKYLNKVADQVPVLNE